MRAQRNGRLKACLVCTVTVCILEFGFSFLFRRLSARADAYQINNSREIGVQAWLCRPVLAVLTFRWGGRHAAAELLAKSRITQTISVLGLFGDEDRTGWFAIVTLTGPRPGKGNGYIVLSALQHDTLLREIAEEVAQYRTAGTPLIRSRRLGRALTCWKRGRGFVGLLSPTSSCRNVRNGGVDWQLMMSTWPRPMRDSSSTIGKFF